MRKHIATLCFIILACIAPFNQSYAEDGVLDITVGPFFAALQAGDIAAVKSYTSGILYEEITEASRQNKDYGAFLRERYAGAIFYPTVLQEDEDKMVFSVNVEFEGKGASVFELLVEKDSTGSWRIVDQYSP